VDAVNERERTVRSMTRGERRTYLLERGWGRLGGDGVWVGPGEKERYERDDPRGRRPYRFYSLAAAITWQVGVDVGDPVGAEAGEP
jgi:hypothetical protein